jgi:formylglycine-generating enzyme required for sulfatase activity
VADVSITPDHALYFQYPGPPAQLPATVGSHSFGQGGFFRNAGQGHEDLAGNLAEWVFDPWTEEPLEACKGECIATGADDEPRRVTRGGSFELNPDYARAGSRAYDYADIIYPTYGFRCARDTMPSEELP